MKTWIKYLLYQVPGWVLIAVVLFALNHWLGLSLWMALGIFLLWLIKDFALYPLLKRSFEPHGKTPVEQMIGLRGVACDRIDPDGYIQVRGEFWRAETHAEGGPILAGSPVKVVEADGMTLIVVTDASR